MEEEKVAAYYNELRRKSKGAVRFKQGLGYSSAPSSFPNPPPPSSAPSSSFLSIFVRASSSSTAAKLQKEAQLHTIQNKLSKPKNIPTSERDVGHKHHHKSNKEEDYIRREES